jgi:hypothetical protein
MSLNPSNVTSGVLIFIMFIALFTGTYTAFEDKYGISRDATSCPRVGQTTNPDCVGTTQSIGEALQTTITIDGVNKTINAIMVFSVPGNILIQSFEVLTGAGLGIIQIFLGLIVLPGQIANIILQYYYVPSVFAITISILFNVYIAFILLRYLLKME